MAHFCQTPAHSHYLNFPSHKGFVCAAKSQHRVKGTVTKVVQTHLNKQFAKCMLEESLS